jgi:arylsulfatase
MKKTKDASLIASLLAGLRLGLLACLWALAVELLYGRALLSSPVSFEPSLLALYLLVFGGVGLAGGVAGAVLRRLGHGVPALVVGALLTFLLVGMRLHDLSDHGIDLRLDGALLAGIAVVATAVGMLARPLRERAVPGVLLAAYVPALVVASKLLVNTSPIPLAHPIPTALSTIVAWPLALTLLYRIALARSGAGAPLAAASWFAPLAMVAVSFVYAPEQATPVGVANAATARTDDPPIIWITIDTLRADHMSVYGYDVPTTPNLERLAQTATLYTACNAQAPSTWQSVPSMFSGVTPYRHGGVTESRKLREDLDLLPEILARRGYQTVGQSANPWVSERYGMTQGFEDFRLYNTDDQFLLYDVMKLGMRVAPWDMFRLRELLPSYAYVPAGTLVDEATKIVRARDTARPLFLYMQPIDPHGPYQAPLRYVHDGGEGFRREDYVSYWKLKKGVSVTPRQHEGIVALYDGAIAYTDNELGRFFDTLRANDLFDRALIVITADHGEQFYDHELWRHSNSLYQQLLHVPLIVKYPGQQRGEVVRDRVDTIDVLPTIMRALGDDCRSCEGRALQSVGTTPARPSYAYLMAHHEVRPVLRSVLSDGWKLIFAEQKDGKVTEELYDVAADPQEGEDQRLARADIASRLARLLETYEAEAGPTPAADTIELGPAETQRLRALGYVQ